MDNIKKIKELTMLQKFKLLEKSKDWLNSRKYFVSCEIIFHQTAVMSSSKNKYGNFLHPGSAEISKQVIKKFNGDISDEEEDEYDGMDYFERCPVTQKN